MVLLKVSMDFDLHFTVKHTYMEFFGVNDFDLL